MKKTSLTPFVQACSRKLRTAFPKTSARMVEVQGRISTFYASIQESSRLKYQSYLHQKNGFEKRLQVFQQDPYSQVKYFLTTAVSNSFPSVSQRVSAEYHRYKRSYDLSAKRLEEGLLWYYNTKELYHTRAMKYFSSLHEHFSSSLSSLRERIETVKAIFEDYQIFFTVSGTLLSAGAAWFGYTSRRMHMAELEYRLDQLQRGIERVSNHDRSHGQLTDTTSSEPSGFLNNLNLNTVLDGRYLRSSFSSTDVCLVTVASGLGSFVLGYAVGWRRARTPSYIKKESYQNSKVQ